MTERYSFNVHYKTVDVSEWQNFQFSSVSQLDDFLNKYGNVIKAFEFVDYPRNDTTNFLNIIDKYDSQVNKLIKINIINTIALSLCILYIAVKK